MNFLKEEDEDEENISPNLSSEEFKELTDKNDKLNKSLSKTKSNNIIYSIDSNDDGMKKMVYSVNNKIFTNNEAEEKNEYLNLKISSENENDNEEINFNIDNKNNEHEINNSKDYEQNIISNMPYIENEEEKEKENYNDNQENEIDNYRISISNNIEKNRNNEEFFKMKSSGIKEIDNEKNENKNMNSINTSYNENNENKNKENHYFNKEIDKDEDKKNNKNYNFNYKQNIYRNNNINTNDKNSNEFEKESENIFIKDNNEKNEKNQKIINKILDDRNTFYSESEISNNYQAFLNEKMNLFQKEMNEKKEKVGGENKNKVNNGESLSYKKYIINEKKNNNYEDVKYLKNNEMNYLDKKNEMVINNYDKNINNRIKNGKKNNIEKKDEKKDNKNKFYYFSYEKNILTTNAKTDIINENIIIEENKMSKDSQVTIEEKNQNKKPELIDSIGSKNIPDENLNNVNIMNDKNINLNSQNKLNNKINMNNNYNNYQKSDYINNNTNINKSINNNENITQMQTSKNINIEIDNKSYNYKPKNIYLQNIPEKNIDINIMNNNNKSNPSMNNIIPQLAKNSSEPNFLKKHTEKSIEINKYISNNYKNNENQEKNIINLKKSGAEPPEGLLISKNFDEIHNSPKLTDSLNVNTLESVTLKRIGEEEEKRTMELQQEEKKLNDLEKEKIQLIEEEKEIRQKIIEEIKRQEEKEEKKKRLKMKYIESMRKRKEDEEKLKQIKLKQEKELKEINELKSKKRMQEEKLLLLLEGKLNKQEIRNYRKSIENEETQDNSIINKYKVPFHLCRDNDTNKSQSQRGINSINNEFMENNYKYPMVDENEIEENININNIINENIAEKQNNYRKRKTSTSSSRTTYQENLGNNNYIKKIAKINNNENNLNINNSNKYLLPKESLTTINTTKNKASQMSLNSAKIIEKDININEYLKFSPSIITKKNTLSLSPLDNPNNYKIDTELDQLMSFSPVQNENQKNEIIQEYILNKENNIDSINDMNVMGDKKIKKNIKRLQKKSDNNIRNKYEKKNIKEKLIKEDNAKFSNENNNENFNDNDNDNMTNSQQNNLNNISNKNVGSISNEQILYKTKSTSAINPYLKYKNKKPYQNNTNINYSYSNRNNNKLVNGQKEIKTKDENNINSRNNKYIYEKEEKIPKQKSFVEEYNRPNEIKKEYIIGNNENKRKENIQDIQVNFGKSTYDPKYKMKKEKIKNVFRMQENGEKVEENKNYNTSSQRMYYKDYRKNEEKNSFKELNENDNFMDEQNNFKFMMYYKEIYGDNKK